VNSTAAEKKMRSFMPPSDRTKDQARRAELRRDIRKGVQAGTPEGKAKAQAAAETGELSKAQIRTATRSARFSSLQAGVRAMPLPQALSVYEVATPAERASLRPILLRAGSDGKNKVQRGILTSPPNARPRLQARVQAMMALPYAGQEPVAAAR